MEGSRDKADEFGARGEIECLEVGHEAEKRHPMNAQTNVTKNGTKNIRLMQLKIGTNLTRVGA